jgi:hypothetical protein
MAVTYGDIGTGSSGTGTRTPGIPANTGADDVVVVFEGITNNVTRGAGTLTSGGSNGTWAELLEDVGNATLIVDWKALTGADTGSYSTPGHATQNTSAVALRFDGADTASPFFATTSINRTSSATTAAVSLNSVPAGSCLVWFCRGQGAGSTGTVNTPPSGFTVRTAGSSAYHVATLDNFAGGNTGSLTATLSSSCQHGVLLLALVQPPVNVTVNAVAATATSTAPVPTVTGIQNATVAAVVAAVTALAPIPTVTGTQDGTVSPPAATSTATAPVPTVTAVQNATVAAVAATATAAAPVPFVGVVQHAQVDAVAATATSLAPVPVVTGIQNGTVAAVSATATTLAPAPTVTSTQNPTVAAVAATATALALPPMVYSETAAPRRPTAQIRDNDAEATIRPNQAKAELL